MCNPLWRLQRSMHLPPWHRLHARQCKAIDNLRVHSAPMPENTNRPTPPCVMLVRPMPKSRSGLRMLANRPGRAASSPSVSALLRLLLPTGGGGGGGGRCDGPPADAHTPPAQLVRRRWRRALLQGSRPGRPASNRPMGMLQPSEPPVAAQQAPGRRPQTPAASIVPHCSCAADCGCSRSGKEER